MTSAMTDTTPDIAMFEYANARGLDAPCIRVGNFYCQNSYADPAGLTLWVDTRSEHTVISNRLFDAVKPWNFFGMVKIEDKNIVQYQGFITISTIKKSFMIPVIVKNFNAAEEKHVVLGRDFLNRFRIELGITGIAPDPAKLWLSLRAGERTSHTAQ
ncbi:MAG: hypothetical protein NTZ05_08345 [Chloroflexi bacterium]|nr:hypothetical protein [Chloroflexota bacterium]